jgi:hypothetical protein
MKRLSLLTAIIIFSSLSSANATSLKDYSPYRYEVLFTNPECSDYFYPAPIKNNMGESLHQKPKGAYCKKQDAIASASREDSPEYRLIQWIRSNKTREIFFSYLSFSNKRVADELCQAVVNRNVKISFLLDIRTNKTQAKKLLACRPKASYKNPNLPKVYYRGHQKDLGYAHNKYFIVNPKSQDAVRIAFSSGNLSSGTVLHHENWHFITTNINSYFAQIHLCMKEGTINHAQNIISYTTFIASCRQSIANEEEEDIKVFLIPGDGKRAMKSIAQSLQRSDRVYLAAHRFSNRTLIGLLKKRLLSDSSVDMKLVADDDLYWTQALGVEKFGANRSNEQRKINWLAGFGLKVHYIQTNHNSFLLHHNKFIVFQGDNEASIFAGAGNLTTAAFTKNFENFYHIRIPHVVKRFEEQYQHLYHHLGSNKDEMPVNNLLP